MGFIGIFNKIVKRILIAFAALLYICCVVITCVILRATGVINIKTETDYKILWEWWWNKDENGESIIDIADVMPFEWDYLIAYNSDCDVENIKKELGIEKCSRRFIGDKGVALINNREVVFLEVWYKEFDILRNRRKYPRGLVFFTDSCFYTKKDDAKFRASKGEDGYLWLEKIE